MNKEAEGGVAVVKLMACSGSTVAAVALAAWIVFQLGSQTALTLTAVVPVPPVHADWTDPSSDRTKRGVRRLPPLDNRELQSTVSFVENQLTMMGRHEKNIMSSDVKVKLGSALHGAYIDSMPSTDALTHGKDAMVALKASKHIGDKYCFKLGIDEASCAAQVGLLSVRETELGARCAAHYRHAVFCSEAARYRSADGSCNHPHRPAWGQALAAYRRVLPPQYDDGFQRPRGSTLGQELPSARLISTTLSQSVDAPDPSVTLAALQWGRFVAADMAHTGLSKMWNTGGSIACCDSSRRNLSPRHVHASCFPIAVPDMDPVFGNNYQTCMSYVRSLPALTPDCSLGPLQQLNQATPLLDGSMLYGNSAEKAASLRSRQFGRLRTVMRHGRDFLPTIHHGLNVHCHIGKNGTCYQTGDARVNAQPHQGVMQTLWLREHNRVADRLATVNPHWADERLYQEAKRIVTAQIQHITYNEWLPVVLGIKHVRAEPQLQPRASGPSDLYRDDVDPAVSNSFANAALRALNSMVDDQVRLYNEERSPDLQLTVSARHFHLQSEMLQTDDKLDALVRGLATQNAQKMDLHHSRTLQHELYSTGDESGAGAGAGGLDAFSLDIQRGRDHGLPSYNAFRAHCGIRRARHFADLADTVPQVTIDKLRQVYKSVEDIDLLVGGMAEYAADGLVGPVLKCVFADQFKRTRSGDRFFYDNAFLPGAFTDTQLEEIKKTTLARIFCDNTNNVLTMQPYVFYKPVTPSNDLTACSESTRIRRMSLEPWREAAPRSVLQGL